MNIKVIDNFLNQDEFNIIKNDLIDNKSFPLYFGSDVSGISKTNHNYWNYYFSHVFYENDRPISNHIDSIYRIFIPKFKKIYPFKSLLRIKLNFYPYTENLKEHEQHYDSPFSHYGAVFSLNTCDGFTRLYDGTKIDSVENRILFFDPSLKHNSSTTTNSKGRWNINFNFL
tara:strand:+ start:903 stop:1415 length:513 start_codon:yes stop_codon:yes gene_type:complete